MKIAMIATRNMGLIREWEEGFNRKSWDYASVCEHICFPGMNFTDLAGVAYADSNFTGTGMDYARNPPVNNGKSRRTAEVPLTISGFLLWLVNSGWFVK